MELYAGIDLHSNNSVIVVLGGDGREIYRKRVANDLKMISEALHSCGPMTAVAVESTFNWYWLVDGLKDAGFTDVRLANTAAIKQYDGLKHGDDFSDARHLADLMRLKVMPTGYIYPPQGRAVRDLLRKRSQLVRQRTTQLLSMQNLLARNLGQQVKSNDLKRWGRDDVAGLPLLDEHKLALESNLAVMRCLDEQIDRIERAVLKETRSEAAFKALHTVSGIGDILALTILLETGDIARFNGPGNFASYARAVDSRRESNGKKKGQGNTKCGNKFLAWAFVEAAHFAVRYDETIKRWYQKKVSKTLPVVAIKAVAHKLARACYHLMKDGGTFDVKRAFS